MYTALEVAKYIINKCIELNRPISNLQLQKILYYVQGEYMNKNNGQALFNDDIEAWQYGPVIPNVYYKYNIYSSTDIEYKQKDIELDDKIKNVIDPIISEKSKLIAWKLIKSTLSESPWIEAFKEFDRNKITEEQMKKFFCT